MSLVALAGAGCGGDAATEESAGSVVPVAAEPARLQTLRDTFSGTGTVVPAASTDWTLTASEPSRIAELTKAEGDAVAAGEVLVRLEIPSLVEELAAADSAVVEAATKVANARAEVTKLAPLHEKGMIARTMFDGAREALATAETTLRQAELRRETAREMGDRANIRARFAGIVIKRWKLEGQFVAGTATDGILRVIDPNKVQVLLQVPIARFARITPGHAAVVQSGGGPPEAATVTSRQLPTDAAAASAEVRLDFTTATAIAIDSMVQVEMIVDERRDVVVVPSAAVRRDDAGSYVMIAGEDNLAHRRDVRPGLVVGTVTQIVSGLNAGEPVITLGLDQISDGSRISTR
jgi:RND family efflux transporter MFP subunit